MKYWTHTFFLFAFIFGIFPIYGQMNVDSLNATWNNNTLADSIRHEALQALVEHFLDADVDSAKHFIDVQISGGESQENGMPRIAGLVNLGEYHYLKGDYINCFSSFKRAYDLAKKAHNDLLTVKALNGLGVVNFQQGNFESAITQLFESIELSKTIDQQGLTASAQLTLANVYNRQGDFQNAIKLYSTCMATNESLGNIRSVGTCLSNIGIIYAKQADNEKALEYLNKCLEIQKNEKNMRGVATALSNLGILHRIIGEQEKAMEYYNQSAEISRSLGDVQVEAATLTNIAYIYRKRGNYAKAIEYLDLNVELYEDSGNKPGLSNALDNLNSIYYEMGKYDKAIQLSKRSLEIAQEVGAIEQMKNASKALFQAYKATGKSTEALKFYENYIILIDSILDKESQREVLRQEFKYTYEKEALKDSIQAAEAKKVLDAEIEAKNAQLKQEATQRYALFGGLGLLALFGGFMFNRYRVTQRQKLTIERQKHEVEEAHEQLSEKNKEITDSIRYAKRIQAAILPPRRIVKEYLKDSFILYKPKDVVAGDFYWMESVEDVVYFAAADCTGHGVPGAMVSVVCNAGLNRSVREFALRDPARILENTRDLVVKEFEKSDEDVKDGMDISLCALNTKTHELMWAGANNPLWLVKKDAAEIIEVKADKQPIGKYEASRPFTSHALQLSAGDTIYIFSDGYPDQFGGENGKKYKSGKFKKTLIELSEKSIDLQKEFLDQEFEAWRGDLEQIDDVCVIGVRV
jgi:serine phosphatase RsbU (regulator of sigma subunit)/Tfp pilus assembly protein PilF